MKKYITLAISALLFWACDSDSDAGGDNIGQGGSFARLTIAQDHLYAVDEYNLVTFSLEDAMNPRKVDEFELGWGVETIFPMDTLIFIGTQTGMHMLDISDRSRPAYLSAFEHVTSCDPVVAQDTLAFVTLRSGNSCRNGNNQLDVLDIRDLRSPKLLASHDMQNPHGLGVKEDLLFVCEGNYGLKIYEIKKGGDLQLIEFFNEIRSKDVIIKEDNLLIVIAEDGLFQYDYRDVKEGHLELLSQIRIEY